MDDRNGGGNACDGDAGGKERRREMRAIGKICLVDLLKAKDEAFFMTDWLRTRNTWVS